MTEDAAKTTDEDFCSNDALVKQCVDELFNVGQWNEAKRLVVETVSGTDGGGYCRGAVEKIVAKAVATSSYSEWSRLAEKEIKNLLDAHAALDRDALGRALMGLRLLVNR
jgi:hypothetical protein